VLPIRTILHPTDDSDLSRPAFELACSLAREHTAELVVCHVSPPPLVAGGDGLVVETPVEQTEQLAARIERMKPSDPAMRFSVRLVRGDAATEIVRLAAEIKADLIVMGTHGRGGLARVLMGSVAEGVMRKASCPVLTVKAPFPTPGGRQQSGVGSGA
jgi:nucleotide-binding universal stress UspA family protein